MMFPNLIPSGNRLILKPKGEVEARSVWYPIGGRKPVKWGKDTYPPKPRAPNPRLGLHRTRCRTVTGKNPHLPVKRYLTRGEGVELVRVRSPRTVNPTQENGGFR